MRHLAVIASLFLSFPLFADIIDFGQAGKYHAFIKENYSVSSSDVEGRIAVGGNLLVDGQYDIGAKIIDFAMGDGPSLVVGGNIEKINPSGNLAVYQHHKAGETPELGDAIIGGTLTGTLNDVRSLTQNSDSLPVDFNSAFSHLENLSQQLSARTAYGSVEDNGWALIFSVDENVVPENGVYVFNVTQQQSESEFYINTNGMAEDATVVFNISNDTGSSVIDLSSRGMVYITNDSAPTSFTNPLSNKFIAGEANTPVPFQLLYNFYGASQLNLDIALYGSILAPTADIAANGGQMFGQVIGKSWQANRAFQTNYNPFQPTGSPATSVPEPSTFIIFAVAFLMMLSRNTLSKIRSKLTLKQFSSFA
ncbi:MAG: choice-of-anchor A domain-containing protein [Colwellia sp.]|jgi:choice-of-anchor A domain-containing protein